MKSKDGGISWSSIQTGTKESLIFVSTPDADHNLWVVASDGSILHSSDQGQSWTLKVSGTLSHPLNELNAAWISRNGRTVWGVGNGGRILKSIDCGENWILKPTGVMDFFTSIAATDDGSNLWVAGSGGTVLKSNNGGETWSVRSAGTKEPLSSIAISADGRTVWSAGYEGIFFSIDGGETWSTVNVPDVTLYSIHISSDGRTPVAAGQYGRIVTVGMNSILKRSPAPWFYLALFVSLVGIPWSLCPSKATRPLPPLELAPSDSRRKCQAGVHLLYGELALRLVDAGTAYSLP